MPRHGAREDSAHPHASVVDFYSVAGAYGSNRETDPGRRMVGPAKTGRRSFPRAETDPPPRQREFDRFTDDEIESEGLRRLWRFEPQLVIGESDSPSPAEGHSARLTGRNELLEELGLTSGHSVKSDPSRLGVQPPGAERGWETANRGHRHAAVGLPWIDPRCPRCELGGEKDLVCSQGFGQVDEMMA
jgi:hypothetical protein